MTHIEVIALTSIMIAGCAASYKAAGAFANAGEPLWKAAIILSAIYWCGVATALVGQ